MGEHDQDQDGVAEPARPPLSVAQARKVTAGLSEAMDDVRRSVAVLAAQVRDAHAARVCKAPQSSRPAQHRPDEALGRSRGDLTTSRTPRRWPSGS
jgi:hypothetical protein